MANQEKAIEQLWFAYSRHGLDTGGTGQRPRAASQGLRDVKSARVKNLTYFLRYDPPEGAVALISPANAPVCLAFTKAGQERILVHKLYVGPALGRDGTFFVHVLVGLPETFSADDAISLWDADFWRASLRDCEWRESADAALRDDSRKTSLAPIPFTQLLQWRKDMQPVHVSYVKKIQDYFPAIVEAFLTKKNAAAQQQNRQTVSSRRQLYVAAPDRELAHYIAGLTHCLPEQFVRELTFSTYETDLLNAKTEIVGTCWLSGEQAEHDPQAQKLFADPRYAQKLTLNCYLPPPQSLQGSPFIEYDPLAAPFARTAAEYFIGKNHQLKKRYTRFLQRAERIANLTLKQFFQLYNEFFAPDTQAYHDLEEALSPETTADWSDTVIWLANHENQLRLLNRAIGQPDWWLRQGRNAILHLCQHEGPGLARVLAQVAHLAISYAVNIVTREAPAAAAALAERKPVEKNVDFGIVIDVIHCAAPPERDTTIWLSLYDRLHSRKLFFDFLRTQPEAHALLMEIWGKMLPFSLEELSPTTVRRVDPSGLSRTMLAPRRSLEAMLPATWLDFGHYLTLDSPLATNEQAAKKLLETSSLTAEQARELAERYHEQIRTFLYQLAQTEVIASQRVASSVFNALALAAYPEKIDLLYVLLMSAMAAKEEHIARLLKLAELSPDENVAFLTCYGPECLKHFQRSQTLLECVKRLLEYLPKTDLSVFQAGSSPLEATPIEDLFWSVVEAQLPTLEPELCYSWYITACAIRNPLMFQGKVDIVAQSMSELLWQYTFSPAARARFFRALAQTCIATQNSLEEVIAELYMKVLPGDLWLLLHTIAELAGSQLHWGGRAVIVQYILFALHFSANFEDKNECWLFVQSFLNTLLKDADSRLLKWINGQMRRQDGKDTKTWKRFASQFTPLPAPQLSRFERQRFNHERNVALKRLKRAMKGRDLLKLGMVAIEYATTLSQHRTLLSEEELKQAQEGVVVINELEERALQRYALLHPSALHVVGYGPPSPAPSVSPPAQPGLLQRWLQRQAAFARMRDAFRRGSIGRIVLLKKLDREILEHYRERKPVWWKRIEAAEQFFNACQQADALPAATDAEKRAASERALDRAAGILEDLQQQVPLAPGLNVHELVRREMARQYKERQFRYEKLHIKREYKPHSLRPNPVS